MKSKFASWPALPLINVVVSSLISINIGWTSKKFYDTKVFVHQKRVFNFIGKRFVCARVFAYKEALIAAHCQSKKKKKHIHIDICVYRQALRHSLFLSTQIIAIFTNVDLCLHTCTALHMLLFLCVCMYIHMWDFVLACLLFIISANYGLVTWPKLCRCFLFFNFN